MAKMTCVYEALVSREHQVAFLLIFWRATRMQNAENQIIGQANYEEKQRKEVDKQWYLFKK